MLRNQKSKNIVCKIVEVVEVVEVAEEEVLYHPGEERDIVYGISYTQQNCESTIQIVPALKATLLIMEERGVKHLLDFVRFRFPGKKWRVIKTLTRDW